MGNCIAIQRNEWADIEKEGYSEFKSPTTDYAAIIEQLLLENQLLRDRLSHEGSLLSEIARFVEANIPKTPKKVETYIGYNSGIYYIWSFVERVDDETATSMFLFRYEITNAFPSINFDFMLLREKVDLPFESHIRL